jgi:hypothetical protein
MDGGLHSPFCSLQKLHIWKVGNNMTFEKSIKMLEIYYKPLNIHNTGLAGLTFHYSIISRVVSKL